MGLSFRRPGGAPATETRRAIHAIGGRLIWPWSAERGARASYGHPAGDARLQAIAARLKVNLRTGDTLARLGGDEFALILAELDEPSC